jgi:excinuclease UvrABC helicase subunit UvrB/very-short-patch-repair endonuclease
MFNLRAPYQPGGDQPKAIEALTKGLSLGRRHQTLKGATGTGKTFVMANIIQNVQKPTLVIAHNKTLAAQLYGEFASFFPESAVHYFVSYFDYYQPEAYIASSDTYIEKDSKINEEIDRLRHAATSSLLEGKDVIIVASVSCIYGIGSVEDYGSMAIKLKVGELRKRDKLLRHLSDIQYHRNDIDFGRGTFRVRGDVVDVIPASGEEAYRIDFFGDEIESITKLNPLTGEILGRPDQITIYPGSHYVTPHDKVNLAVKKIEDEYESRKEFFLGNNRLLEEQRLTQRIKFDLEMLKNTGFVKGIENYSRYLTNREEGDQPATLLDYFPDDYLMFIDESHMTMPQIRGMYNGDRARKETLVEYGFRLPSALDNRPLRFDEFVRHQNQTIYVSATPAEYEMNLSLGEVSPTNSPSPEASPTENLNLGLTPNPSPIGEGSMPEEKVEAIYNKTFTAYSGSWNKIKDLAKDNRQNQTVAENLLWQNIRSSKLGIKFRRQHIVDGFILDFFSVEKGLALEIDGGYHNEAEQAEYDKMRQSLVEDYGITFLRFTNQEVENNLRAVLTKIKAAAAPLSKWRGVGGEAKFEAKSLSLQERDRDLPQGEAEVVIGDSRSGGAENQVAETSHPAIVEQIIRPTGLIDPAIDVKPAKHQIDDAVEQIKLNVDRGERVLVTTLTKRMAEDLTDYLEELKFKVAYIHSDVDTVERTDILRDLRLGVYDILVGINLLREGLDLPEVSLVLILDADKEGFLRSESALIQTIGRAARHLNGRVIMYGDVITRSMKAAIDETNYRREKQIKFNQDHNITPESVKKAIDEGIRAVIGSKKETKQEKELSLIRRDIKKIPKEDKPELIKELNLQMELAAKNLDFERAAELRDVIEELKALS